MSKKLIKEFIKDLESFDIPRLPEIERDYVSTLIHKYKQIKKERKAKRNALGYKY